MGEFVYSVRLVCADVKNLVASCWYFDGIGNNGSDVDYVAEGASLLTVTENIHRFILQNLVYKNSHHVAILVTDDLALAVDVVWTEDDVIQIEHFFTHPQSLFNRKLGNSVGVFRVGGCIFCHGQLGAASVNRYRRDEDKVLDTSFYRSVNQVHAANQVVVVIKAIDEVVQTFSSIGGKVKYVF